MKVVAVRPFAKSVVPGIAVTIAHEFEENVQAFVMSGYVLAADGKIVGNLTPVHPEISVDQERSDFHWQYAPDSISAQPRRQRRPFQQELLCILDARMLEHIENLRPMDSRKDVHLSFVLTSVISSIDVRMGDFSCGAQLAQNQYPVVSSYGRGDRSDSNLRILVVPEHRLFEVRHLATRLSHSIKASDWLHDFAPVLGLGRFLVVEILEPDIAVVKPSELTAEVREFVERIERARGILDLMGKDLQSGEWREVLKKSREFWELFQQESKQLAVKEFVKKLIASTTGLEDEKSANIVQGVGRFYGYASDLLHPVGTSGVKEVFVGGKEDAYLVYSLAASFLNVMVSKFKQFQKK
jgi:hypothetical protein